MRRKKTFGQSLLTSDWMKYRPYDVFSSYDAYYLRLAKEIFKYLNDKPNGFRTFFERDDLKELSILLTCHFEDFISEIGLWQALVKKHEVLHGGAIPFYELDDYDPDYLNTQDFAYLIWHHLGKMSRKSLDPYSYQLMSAADYCYTFFEARIDQAPATDFYDQWLDISPDIFFFELKNRLSWMTFDNYLTGPEFSRGLKEKVDEFAEESEELLQGIENPEAILYGIQNDFLLIKHSSWCALTAPQWLAEVARCPDELRPEIRRLSQRIQSSFLYQGYDKQYYYFEHIQSGQKFSIIRDSVELDVSRMKVGATLGAFGIVNWQGDWWLSGLFWGGEEVSQDRLDKMRIDTRNANFHAWTETQQQQIRATNSDMEEAFLAYFGNRLIFFPDDRTMSKAMQDHQVWWNEQKTKQHPSGKSKSKYTELLKQKPSGFEDFDLGDGATAIFDSPGEGILMSSHIPQIIELLQKKEITREESNQLFYGFFFEFHPALAYYIRENYSLKNLRFPFSEDPDFVKKHFDFFLRYYNPKDFMEVLPNISLLPEA